MKSGLALLLKALAFAAHKHRDQRRKDPAASPYINHPIALADVLVNEGGVTDFEVLCAGLALILGGALGNLWDRVAYGAVVDFLDFHAFGWHWPAFNVADSAITVGVVLLVWDSLRPTSRAPQAATQEKP